MTQRKLTLILSGILLMAMTPELYAQFNFEFDKNYPDSKAEAGAFIDYFISSDAVTVEFQNTYLNDQFIDNELKNKSFDKMDSRSTLGSGLNGGIYFKKQIKDHTDKMWMLGIKHRQHYNSNFSKDMFGLYFYGNKPYAGKTADISDLNYLNLRYQQFQFGFITTKVKDDGMWNLMSAGSFLLGQDYLELSSDRGTFYTQPDGEYIDMDLYLETKQSDSTNSGFGKINGIGASFEFMARYTKENKYHLQFGIKDLGFIAWNNKSTSFVVDTLYHYEGIYIENIFDSLFLDIKGQDEFADGFKKDKKDEGVTTMIPFTVELSYGRILIPEKLTVWAGGNYIFNADYTPLFQIWGDYNFSTRISAGVSVRYGGYAELGAGLHAGFDLGKGYILNLGSNYLTGYIAPSSSTAQAANIGLRKKF